MPGKKRSPAGARDSPQAKKKTKSTDAEFNGKDDYFADNFSQYFHSQFIEQISSAEALRHNRNAAICSPAAKRPRNESTVTSSALLPPIEDNETEDLDESIPLGQKSVYIPTENNDDEDPDDLDATDRDICNSSQLFLHEISAIQMNVNSIIDEALGEDKFKVFTSSVTSSQYIQLQRDSEELGSQANNGEEQDQADKTINADIEAFGRTNAFDSLLAAGIDAFTDETSADGAVNAGVLQKSAIDGESKDAGDSIQKAQPVMASMFYKMGPFYGLPKKVLTLIQQFKGIDDLYGK